MARKKTNEYGNDSITTLKGAERVRKRPSVIFGSDGLEGCQHSVFEILSNSIDEAREGYGKKIVVTRFADGYQSESVSCREGQCEAYNYEKRVQTLWAYKDSNGSYSFFEYENGIMVRSFGYWTDGTTHCNTVYTYYENGNTAFGGNPGGFQRTQGIKGGDDAGLVVADAPGVENAVFLHRCKGGGFDPVIVDRHDIPVTEQTNALTLSFQNRDGIATGMLDLHGKSVLFKESGSGYQNIVHILAEGQAVFAILGNGGDAAQIHQIRNDLITVVLQIFGNTGTPVIHKITSFQKKSRKSQAGLLSKVRLYCE